MNCSPKKGTNLGFRTKNRGVGVVSLQESSRDAIVQEEINTEPQEKSRVDSDILSWNGRDKQI